MGRTREGRERVLGPGRKLVEPRMWGNTREPASSSGSSWWQGLEGQDRRDRERQTSRADRHISGSSPPPKAWISLSFCQKLSGSLVVNTGPNPRQEERTVRWVRSI